MEIVSDWKETLKLRIVDGQRASGILLPATLLDDEFTSIDESWTGVEGRGGEGGVAGLFLSVD